MVFWPYAKKRVGGARLTTGLMDGSLGRHSMTKLGRRSGKMTENKCERNSNKRNMVNIAGGMI